jgi:hypothetical protein
MECLAAVLVILLPSTGVAQTLGDPMVPAGRVRLDLWPSFTTWDARFGLRTDGTSSVDVLERLGSDLTDPVGTSLFPEIRTLEENLGAAIGVPQYGANLGNVSGLVTKEVTRIDAGLSVGVFDWLTVGATIPMVKARTAIYTIYRPDTLRGDLGLNPFVAGDAGVGTLLTGLESASASAAAHASNVCNAGAGSACDAAQALSGQATSFWGQMSAAYGASSFFTLAGSNMALWLQSALAALDAQLTAAGLPGVGAQMVFATETLGADDFSSFPSDPNSGLQGTNLENIDGVWTMGDVELLAHIRLLQGEARDSGAATPRFSYGVTGGALVRLGTGLVDDPNIFLDVGSGDGQMDIEGRVDAFFTYGAHLALRGGFRYGVQEPTSLVRRVAPHEMVLPSPTTTRAVEWSPGSYSLLELSPQWQLSSELALAADYRRYHKGEDTFEMVGDPPVGLPPVDVADLGHETEMSLQEIGIGLRYSTLVAWREGRTGAPVQLGARLVQAFAGSGGQTPKTTRLDLSISLFRRIWGGP